MSDVSITEAQQAERQERFRYVDVNHPLMQVLLTMQIELPAAQQETES